MGADARSTGVSGARDAAGGPGRLLPAAVAGQPAVPVRLAPALVAVLRLVEVRRDRPGQRRADRDHPGRSLRVPGRQLQRVPSTQRQAHDHSPVHSGRVQHRDRVIGVLAVAVVLRGRRPAGPAVTAAPGGDHPEPARQVRHLRLPLPGMHDRPRRKQQDGRFSRAENLVADLDTAALNEAPGIGIPRAHSRLPREIAVPTVVPMPIAD